MGRSLKYEIPGPDWRRSTLDVSARGLVGLFADTLAPPFDVVLEIGFGRGEFLLDLAAKAPDTAFLGVEISFKRVLKLARKLARSGLVNVRLLEGRAEAIVRDLIPAGSLAEVWINFSDPWPKARHAGRRLLQADFVADLTPRLRPGAMLHVATDDVPYAEQIDEVLSAEPGLECTHAPLPWLSEVPGRMHTGYETEWRAEGRRLHFFEYRRRAAGAEDDR
jgi:tRNA (guanine-N7-)-methyltransferase